MVEGVDGNDGDLRSLRVGVDVTGRASVDFLDVAPTPFPFCRAFFDIPSFDMLDGVDVDFFDFLRGDAVGVFVLITLGMIGVVFGCCWKIK